MTKLTPEELKQVADAMIAHAEDKPIQCVFRNRSDDMWTGTQQPSWDFDAFLYRRAPEPTPPVMVPWERRDLPLEAWFRLGDDGEAWERPRRVMASGLVFGEVKHSWEQVRKMLQWSLTPNDPESWQRCEKTA